ncbi:Pentatricopeptide repeat [Trema orientale]|uniref:Pentatricopeptide repeat n=1 Tax=Trema orientale TaxID=63057 RepID=A0A2P5E004_TREOI|nr:Pentatricopeptide repeat [Trema orientale]
MDFAFNYALHFSFWKKLSFVLLQIKSPHLRFFSSHNYTRKSFDKALRVLDLISPKTSVRTIRHREGHLRLIKDILHSTSEQISSQSRSSSEKVLDVFDELLESTSGFIQPCSESFRIDATVLSSVISSCAFRRNLRVGVQYHCTAIKSGFVANVYAGSSLVSLYSKCKELDNAYRVFLEMHVRNVVSWTAIITGFAQEWQIDVCLELFHSMRNSNLRPNDFTFASILSACSGSGALGQGRSIHCQTIQLGFDSYIHISNALISLYCKCGTIEDAFYIFSILSTKDIVSWNSMIVGYAQHGLALQSIGLFEEMKKQNVKADAITFLGVLSACRHVGRVEEGWLYFNSMIEHGVEPELDHYSCVVDLLGRAGLLEEARDFIAGMSIPPNAVIWGSLLSSCRLHKSVWFGIQAAKSKLLLEPTCAATYLQLANLYASVGCWDHAASTRKLMKDRGLKTSPGYSWIEINNVVYIFRVEDRSNTRMVGILSVLDSLLDHMRTLGYDSKRREEETYLSHC